MSAQFSAMFSRDQRVHVHRISTMANKKVGFPKKKDGSPDMRFQMPQELKSDGTRDRRCNVFNKPEFGPPHILVQGQSQSYNPVEEKKGQPGIYLLSTSIPGKPGPKEKQYIGKEKNSGERVNDHGRGGNDNLADLINRTQNQRKTVLSQTAPANSTKEARAQELYMLANSSYSWNSQNNGGRFAGEKTKDGRKRW